MADRDGTPVILVLGLGNLLLGDDGVGIHAVRAFRNRCVPGVLAVDVGTAILRAEHLIEEADYLLVFDAMRAGHAPGSVYTTTLDGVADDYTGDSLHDVTLVSVMRHLKRRPRESVVVAAEPAIIDISMELSAALDDAVTLMVQTAERVVEAWAAGGSAAGVIELEQE